MTKLSVLKHKIIKAYHNPQNWEYSRFKGYPEDTYFGYTSLKECINDTVRRFVFSVRGWGHLTGIGGLHLPENGAARIQDDFIAYILKRLNGE